jgi:rod shape-determining protein MreC
MENLMGRYRNVIILAAAVFIQLIGLAVQVKRRTENDSARLIRVWTVTAITPLEKGIVRIESGARNLWRNYAYLRGVRQENRALQEKIEQLQLEQVRLKQDAEQARRLQALLGFKEQFIDRTTAAQVIGSSGSEQSRTVYLDKGASDGIVQGMAVISGDGIVGKVIQVFPQTAQVLLINDQTSGVGTILEQSRLQGVLKGKASGELVLDKIMTEEDVRLGDRVLTSGGDRIFPKGLPVGTVADIKRGGEFLQVTVRPAAALNHLEEVLVITKKQERESEAAGASAVRASDILAQRLPSVPDKPAPPEDGAKPPAGTAGAAPTRLGLTQRPGVPGTPLSQAPGKPAVSSTALPQPVAEPVPAETPAPSKPDAPTPGIDQPAPGDTPQ